MIEDPSRRESAVQKSKKTKMRMRVDTEDVPDYAARPFSQLQKLQNLERYSQMTYPGSQTHLRSLLTQTPHPLLIPMLLRV
jgi:hypothetical protein